MELWFLGTSAGRPTAGRNVTSIALQMPHNRGTFWLFDCGEATQHQLMRTPLRLSRLERIYITHLHGDHVFGLPGLLSSRSSLGGTDPLDVYGPPGLAELVESALRLSATKLDYELRLHEIGEGELAGAEGFSVEAALLDHRIDSYGYRVSEHARTGALDAARLTALGVPSGPVYGRLKSGFDVTLEDGRTIRAADVLGPPIPGRIVTILGDTRPCDAAVRLASGADVLVHEATFDRTLAEKASLYGHATAEQAAEAALAAGVGTLYLTHFSTRYADEDLHKLEEEARQLFGAAIAAVPLQAYPIDRAKR